MRNVSFFAIFGAMIEPNFNDVQVVVERVSLKTKGGLEKRAWRVSTDEPHPPWPGAKPQ